MYLAVRKRVLKSHKSEDSSTIDLFDLRQLLNCAKPIVLSKIRIIPTCRMSIIKIMCLKFLILRRFLINDGYFMTPFYKLLPYSLLCWQMSPIFSSSCPHFPLRTRAAFFLITVTCILQMRKQRNHTMFGDLLKVR